MAAIATIRTEAPATRNGVAATLANPCFRNRVVKAKSGKGSYNRKDKHKGARGW